MESRSRIFLSLSGRLPLSVFTASAVGIMAWWSETFLLFSMQPKGTYTICQKVGIKRGDRKKSV